MIRTALSFCLLFAALGLVSKLLHQTTHTAPVNSTTDSPASHEGEREAKATQPVPRSTARFLDERRDQSVRLVSFTDEVDEVLNSLRPVQQHNANDDDLNTNDADSKDSSSGSKASPSEPEITITPELAELRTRLRECLAYYYFRPENVAIRSPWGAMHGMIAYGVDTQLIAGDKRVNAIGYLCYNGVCNGQQLFYTTNGKLQARIGPGVQGHPGQFLSMLAQSRVKTDFPMQVEGRTFTVVDLIQYEKETCRARTELTFKLISFMHYLKSDEKWKSDDGQDWDIQRVIKEELAQPIVGAACGGTHRMTGFSYAVNRRAQRGEEFTGQWLRAKKFVEDFHEYTFRLQNPDGSFSTDWFAGRGDNGPPTRRLETTGHITEWLSFSLNKQQLVEPRMIKSVSYLTNLLTEHRDEKWGIGPLGHGLHALAMYDERVFGGKPGTRAVELAEVRNKARRAIER